MKMQLICHWLQSRKGNTVVTLDASQRHGPQRELLLLTSALETVIFALASSFHGE